MNLYNIIFTGSEQALGAAKGMLADAITQHGKDHPVAFPDTAYSLPCIYAATGKKMNTLGDLEGALSVVESLINRTHLLEHALNSGLATALAAEVIEAIKYATMEEPYSAPCAGHVSDPIIRSLGVPLVTGDIPGVAVVLGECPSSDIAAKIVKDVSEAITHINKYGSGHSEAIVTDSYMNSQKFLNKVNAAAVYVNASTRFTDGGEFGFGAEIGISTQKLHARGPMGLKELTTIKYIIYGNGQIR